MVCIVCSRTARVIERPWSEVTGGGGRVGRCTISLLYRSLGNDSDRLSPVVAGRGAWACWWNWTIHTDRVVL